MQFGFPTNSLPVKQKKKQISYSVISSIATNYTTLPLERKTIHFDVILNSFPGFPAKM